MPGISRQHPVRPQRAHLALLALLLLTACASLPRPDAVPASLQEAAQPLGIPGLRLYPELPSAPAAQLEPQIPRRRAGTMAAGVARRSATTPARTPATLAARLTDAPGGGAAQDAEPPLNMLAISAGGDGGAFAAGLLTGWSAAGTRPQFAVVTGVSAGAFIAPFAFLGPRYDGVLREITLSLGPDKLFRPRGLIAGLLGDGFSSSAPLEKLLARYVTSQVLEDIAQEYRQGRDLFILTTDLDAGTPVIWSMGAIAASGAPGSLELFRRVILASVSIPTAVSPVLIDVAAGGRHFRELHVDGGVTHQVFLPASASCAEGCRVFVIMNMHLEIERSATPRRLLKIGSRAVDTLLQSSAHHDLEQIHAWLEPTGAQLRVAYMGSSFKAPHPREFDSAYMRALFAYGVNLATSGEGWHAMTPPAAPPPRAPRPVAPAVAALDPPSATGAAGGEPDEP